MQVSSTQSVDVAGSTTQHLLQQAKGEAGAGGVRVSGVGRVPNEKARIEKAGKDFESILLGSWLQGAEKSFATAPGGEDEDSEDSSRDQFMGMAMQQLAGSLTASGGIGISKMIVSHLEAASRSKATLPQSKLAEEHGELHQK